MPSGAPETNRDDHKSRPVLAQSDVWSLGGVASEALVWSVFGEQGRTQYQEARKKYTDAFTAFKGGYHDGCFHDGSRRLETVDRLHQVAVPTLLGGLPNASPVSLVASDIILTHMLQADLQRRLDAGATFRAWEEALLTRLPNYQSKQAGLWQGPSLPGQGQTPMACYGMDVGLRPGQYPMPQEQELRLYLQDRGARGLSYHPLGAFPVDHFNRLSLQDHVGNNRLGVNGTVTPSGTRYSIPSMSSPQSFVTAPEIQFTSPDAAPQHLQSPEAVSMDYDLAPNRTERLSQQYTPHFPYSIGGPSPPEPPAEWQWRPRSTQLPHDHNHETDIGTRHPPTASYQGSTISSRRHDALSRADMESSSSSLGGLRQVEDPNTSPSSIPSTSTQHSWSDQVPSTITVDEIYKHVAQKRRLGQLLTGSGAYSKLLEKHPRLKEALEKLKGIVGRDQVHSSAFPTYPRISLEVENY